MSEASKVPLGGLPEGWDYREIGRHAELLTGPAFDSGRFSDDPSGVRLARGINVTRGHFRWDADITKFWPKVTPDLERYLLNENDVIIGMDGSLVGRNYAQVTPNDVPSLLVQRVARLRTDANLDPRFLYYLFASDFWLAHVDVVKTHSGIPHISNGDIRGFCISFPPVLQQHKIARILTTLDNVITQTEALIAKYQAIKQGLMHDLFTRGVDATGKLRPPQSEAPELYKSLGNRFIPASWQIASLSDFADVSGGVTLGREIAGTGVVSLPYLRVANVQDGYVDLSEIKTVEILKSEIDRYALCPGDVLMTEGGDFDKLGRGTVWKGQISPCVHQNHVFRVRPLSVDLNSDYLSHLTASAYGRNYFLMCAKQTTNLASINATQVKAFPLILPSPEEQLAIVGHIAAIDNMLSVERARIHKARSTKIGLMQDLLTGEVPVKADELEEITP